MDFFEYNGVDMAVLLPRIPEELTNGLPFGLVKLDPKGRILEYNMAEGDLTGVDPKWAIGKNFFDEVALCTKTAGFYGRFVEGVRKGFLNTVFDYVFDHRSESVKVRVQMVLIPDHRGNKQVIIMVKRANKPMIERVALDAPAAQTSAPVAKTPVYAPSDLTHSNEQNAYEVNTDAMPVSSYTDENLARALQNLQDEFNSRATNGTAVLPANPLASQSMGRAIPQTAAAPAVSQNQNAIPVAKPAVRKKHVDIVSF